jgi:phosphodiesterase/alkaline phosphatase D-like protein
MSRRIFFQRVTALAVSSSLAGVSYAKGVKPQTDDTGVIFTHGVQSAKMPDGSWNLVTRAIAVDEHSTVNLLLEVATDEPFSNIFYREKNQALPSNSYMVRTNFKPEIAKSLLYFRFINQDLESYQSRSLVTLQDPRKIGSKVGRLNPWE